MEGEVTVPLRLPKSAYELCNHLASMDGMDVETYLISGIKDLVIGDLVYLVELIERPETDQEDKRRELFEDYVVSRTSRPFTELTTAPRVAEALGVRDFIVQPHHSDGWDDDTLDIPI